jgi:hypothetical protein
VGNKITPCHPRRVTWHSKMTWPMTWLPSGPVGHPVWPPRLATRRAPCLAPVGHPVRPPSGRKKKKNFFFFFWLLLPAGKEGKKYFSFQSPRSPRSPSSPSSSSSAGFAGEAARRRRFFWPSSPSHPSELYSSLGWLNSKVPKPFFPFTLRLIDVDGF